MNIKEKLAALDANIQRLQKIGYNNLSADQREQLEDLAMEAVKLNRAAKKAGPRLTVVDGGYESKTGPFKTLGEQMMAIRVAGMPGGQADRRLYEVRAATGLSESVPSDGGFLLQQDFSSEIMTNVWSTGEVLSRCKRMPLTNSSIKIPGVDETSRATGSRHGGIRGYWVDEAAEKTASKPKFRQIELNLRKMVILVYATDELLEDVAALGAYLGEVMVDEARFQIENAIVNGSGAGQPLGIMNSGCLITAPAETGQAADTVVYQNILKMWSRMPAAARKNAVWLIEQSVEPQLFAMSLAVGTGGSSVFLPGGQLSATPYASLLNRPIIPVEYCSSLGTTGDIILADLSQYIVAEKSGGGKMDMSIHVRFIYDESVFRYVIRVDGQPKLSSAITPFSAGDTLSPFVALATRS